MESGVSTLRVGNPAIYGIAGAEADFLILIYTTVEKKILYIKHFNKIKLRW